ADPDAPDAGEVVERRVDVQIGLPQVGERDPPPRRHEVPKERLNRAGLLRREPRDANRVLGVAGRRGEDRAPAWKTPPERPVRSVGQAIIRRLRKYRSYQTRHRILEPPRDRPVGFREALEDLSHPSWRPARHAAM